MSTLRHEVRLQPLNIIEEHEEKGSSELDDFEEFYNEHRSESDERALNILFKDAMQEKEGKEKEVMFDPTLLESFINDKNPTV